MFCFSVFLIDFRESLNIYDNGYADMNLSLSFKSAPIESFLLATAIALLPVYLFSSGNVQPAHVVLILFAALMLTRRGLSIELWAFLLAGVSVYSFALESFYVVMGGSVKYLVNSAFFFYNFFISVTVYSYCRLYGVSSLVPGLVVASAIALLSVVLVGVLPDTVEGSRSTATFNNPNQLGYFSVCILSLTYLLYRHGEIRYLYAVFLFSIAVFLSIASLSKAAMIPNLLVAFWAFKPSSGTLGSSSRKVEFGFLVLWFFVIFIFLFIVAMFYMEGYFDHFAFVDRLQSIGQEGDSSLESRGYFAFVEANTYQFLFGLGSGGVMDVIGHEVHSTLASVFNTYGIFCFALFFGALSFWVLRLFRAYGFAGMTCLAGPALLYGITHNGTRFAAFWILFSASMAMSSRILKNKSCQSEL